MTGAPRSQIRLPYPHYGQQQVRLQAKRFNWLSAGRRWRKSTLGASVAIEGALVGESWFWGAPTYDQAMIGWNYMRHAVGGYADFKKGRMIVHFPTGGAVIVRSLQDPESARGHSFYGAVLDEGADVSPVAYYDIIQPILADSHGPLWVIGTPKGRNWFYREHRRALQYDDSMAWEIPVIGAEIINGQLVRKPHPLENPYFSFEELQRRFESTPERTFRQEYLAEFIENEGAVFRNIEACLWSPDEEQIRKHKGHRIVIGVDWGQSEDYTVFSIGCADCKRELMLYRSRRREYAYQRARLKAFRDRFKPAQILAESNSMGQPNIEDLRREGVEVEGFQTTATSKPPLIENLALALEKAEWKLINNPIATAELEAYEVQINRHTGRPSYSAPEGIHDDTVIARALMLRAGTGSGMVFL